MNKNLDDVSDGTIKLLAKGARQRVVAWFMKHFPPAPMPLDYHARIAPPFLATPQRKPNVFICPAATPPRPTVQVHCTACGQTFQAEHGPSQSMCKYAGSP
jgi:hypothetical protein